MKRIVIFCILFLWTWGISQDNGILSLNSIFKDAEFISEYFMNIKWSNDSKGFTTLEKSEIKGFKNIVFYDAKSNSKKILLSAKELIPQGSDKPVYIEDYQFTEDNNYVLIFTNSKRVWRDNTKGDYWIFDIKKKNLRQIGEPLPASSLMFAKFSPDMKRIAYVCNNNIYSENIEDGVIVKLTFDGSETIINGTTDWVYEEELHYRDAFYWNSESNKIVYLQLNAEGIGVFNMINYTDSIYSKIIPIQYPKVGTKNSACRAGVVDIFTKETVWMKIEGDQRNNYLARITWAANPGEVLVQQLNRKQNQNSLLLCNALTGDVKNIYTDKDECWLKPCDDLIWLEKGKSFTFLSERSGWTQLYKISRNGESVKELTPSGMDVINIVKIDEKNDLVYFYASPKNATQKFLFKTDMSGRKKIEKITPSERGFHSYTISADGTMAIHSFSDFDTPSNTELVTLPDHKSVRYYVENKKLKEKLNTLKISKGEFEKIKTDDAELDCWIIKPFNFDKNKKYPVFVHVYGENASQTVIDRYGGAGYLWHQMLAQKGYIVLSIDNRGTPAPKGREFKKSIYKKVGILSSEDQYKGLTKLLDTYNWMDKDRVGIWGWSGGGSMTLNMLFRYPDLYKMGISVAPVTNQLLYDTIYQERYMSLPDDNLEGYKNGSPITYAHQLKGDLLLIHGTGDDNVHYQNSEVLINELVKHNKQFTMFAYPNRSHGIYEGEGTTLHLYTMMTNYLLNHLKPGAKE